MEVSAVIGANYGDEGKGLVTDYLSDEKTLVVRHNGGAQAGHTVSMSSKGSISPHRHVFHHVGSGTLSGAATFLSKFFIINPPLFVKEHNELRKAGFHLTMYGDSEALLTTPYDMMLNQAVEARRGSGRHGSCGFGVNETVTRCGYSLFKTKLYDVADVGEFKKTLNRIRQEYLPQRMKELDITAESMPHLDNEELFEHFIEDMMFCDDEIEEASLHSLTENGWEKLVFEGAQGLMLDEQGKDYPHVTRSRTGLHNVHALLREANIHEPIKAHYVTRTYLTRHGAGPLPNETDFLPYKKIVDKTNIENPFQGKLRFGYLDIVDLLKRIQFDFGIDYSAGQAWPSNNVYPKLVMTCMDQTDKSGSVKMFSDEGMEEWGMRELRDFFLNNHIKEVLFSRGPTAGDIFK